MSHVPDASTLPVSWWKSSRSDSGVQCIECGVLDGQTVAIRDSKQPAGPALLFGCAAVESFVRALDCGELR